MNADKLGGAGRPSGYQRFCSGRRIKATAVVNTTGAGATFANVPGFNCFQPGNLSSSVQIERLAQGQYLVRFVGNSGPERIRIGRHLDGGRRWVHQLRPGESIADPR